MTATLPTPTAVTTEARDVDVAVLGAGFSGIGMAIRLKQAGFHDFVVLERGDDVGGTWHYNTYPGCACDVPSHLYSFSFAPNPDWSHTYSPQPEIHAYLRRCVDDFGIRPFIRLRHEITSAEWDDAERRWLVSTTQGDYRARVLVSGLGPLVEPKIPDISGLDTFEGTTFHSARWNHDYDLRGKRVASIGTGASAIQYVPAIQPDVRQLHVFQRTPPWISPHSNRPVTDLERRLYRALPAAQKLVRGGIFASREALVLGFVKNPRLMKVVERVARRHMKRYIRDPELLRKVTPDYTIGCKRILPSNRWHRTLTKPNVELVTEGVKEVRPRSIVSADGVEREVDAIVFGTGFHVTDMPATRYVRGRHGTLLSEEWEHSPRAYLGTAAPGFPNLFLLLGPNTGLGHSSIVYMIESQIRYVIDALRTMRSRELETVEVLESALDRYNADLERKMEGTVWTTGGCASWYLDDTGRNATQWPDWTWRFRQRTARFDAADYAVRAPAPGRERQPVAA